MSQIIPNEESWIGFVPGGFGGQEFGVADFDAPTQAEIAAAIDMTDFTVTINPTTTGNPVPIPKLKRRFEESINGTASGGFTATMYRDDEDDLAWRTLPRGTKGTFIISRFGGTGADLSPAVGDNCECWAIRVSTRAGDAMQSGTPQSFTLTAATPKEPGEDAVAAA